MRSYSRKYKQLEALDQQDIKYAYTPFDQGALVEILDDNWRGSCNALAHDWMLRKASQAKMSDPTCYSITEPFLPHPVIVGNNDSSGEDIQAVQKKFGAIAEVTHASKHDLTTARADKSGINGLSDYVFSKEFHCGIITVSIVLENGDSYAHALAFVKRGDEVSFFDPNHGEITFQNQQDFSVWLHAESKGGVLRYLADDAHKMNMFKESDLFGQPTADETYQKRNNPLEDFILEKRSKVHEKRSVTDVLIVCQYAVNSYLSDVYVNPEKAVPVEKIDKSPPSYDEAVRQVQPSLQTAPPPSYDLAISKDERIIAMLDILQRNNGNNSADDSAKKITESLSELVQLGISGLSEKAVGAVQQILEIAARHNINNEENSVTIVPQIQWYYRTIELAEKEKAENLHHQQTQGLGVVATHSGSEPDNNKKQQQWRAADRRCAAPSNGSPAPVAPNNDDDVSLLQIRKP